MKNILFKMLSMTVLLIFFQRGFSQVTISGPTCIVPGTLYQYVVNAQWDSASSVQVCITGGVLADSSYSNTCTASLHAIEGVLVIWNDSASSIGSLAVTSSQGSASLTVHIIPQLLPGVIDSGSKVQVISDSSMPTPIACSLDSGGSCSPLYSHQWQWSSDMVTWINIPLATGQSLSIDSVLTQSKFYRRKVTETSTGSIGYSDAASVLIVLPQTDTTNQTDSVINGNSGLNMRHFKMTNSQAFNYTDDFVLLQKQWMRRENHLNEVHS